MGLPRLRLRLISPSQQEIGSKHSIHGSFHTLPGLCETPNRRFVYIDTQYSSGTVVRRHHQEHQDCFAVLYSLRWRDALDIL